MYEMYEPGIYFLTWFFSITWGIFIIQAIICGCIHFVYNDLDKTHVWFEQIMNSLEINQNDHPWQITLIMVVPFLSIIFIVLWPLTSSITILFLLLLFLRKLIEKKQRYGYLKRHKDFNNIKAIEREFNQTFIEKTKRKNNETKT